MAGGASIEESFTEAEGVILGEYGKKPYLPGSGMRSIYWDGDIEDELDLPWRLVFREKEQWLPAQWRLFYALTSTQQEEILEDDGEQLIGQIIGGNLELMRVLGCGSTGTVFLARHLTLNEERAIKITHPVIGGYEALKQIILAGNQGLILFAIQMWSVFMMQVK